MPSALLRDKNGLTEEEFLAAYRPKDYPRPSLTADIAVFSQEAGALQVLLVRRGGHPFLGKWALPGGFAQPGEAVTQTARRELEEETGLKGLRLTPVGLFSQPGRDPRMWVRLRPGFRRGGGRKQRPGTMRQIRGGSGSAPARKGRTFSFGSPGHRRTSRFCWRM